MKRIVSIIIFCSIIVGSIPCLNDIFVEKSMNCYYILSKELETIDDIDVQVYGSCHAYTSFNSKYFSGEYGISSYNMANPSEIMPITYLRMSERFKQDVPKVVLVETWGVNAYETYIPTDAIMEKYSKPNIEDIPLSREKIEVIRDFEALDMLEDNFAIVKYKDRLVNLSLSEIDFQYSFERIGELENPDEPNTVYKGMKNRLSHNGYMMYDSDDLSDYSKLQATVGVNEVLEVEEDLMKYIDKIIELCEENDVKLIFYRAPYRSSENELKKVNYLEQYFDEKNVTFYDLEKELEYNYTTDFQDYWHLSVVGAKKATQFLGEKIMEAIEQG